MFNRQDVTTRALLRKTAMATQAQASGAQADRPANEHIRLLLKGFGLRSSLVRLKVLDALLVASGEGKSLGVRGVHGHLLRLNVPLSFLSVREVLKRLCDEGVITLNADKTYSLDPRASEWLNHPDNSSTR